MVLRTIGSSVTAHKAKTAGGVPIPNQLIDKARMAREGIVDPMVSTRAPGSEILANDGRLKMMPTGIPTRIARPPDNAANPRCCTARCTMSPP